MRARLALSADGILLIRFPCFSRRSFTPSLDFIAPSLIMSLRSAFPMLLRAAAQKPAAMMAMGNHAASTGAMLSASSSLMPALHGDAPMMLTSAGLAFPSRGFASSADVKKEKATEPTAHAGIQMHGVSRSPQRPPPSVSWPHNLSVGCPRIRKDAGRKDAVNPTSSTSPCNPTHAAPCDGRMPLMSPGSPMREVLLR